MKIKWSIVLLSAFGIVAALAAAVLAASLSAEQIQAVVPSEPEDVTILVATVEMKAMTKINADAIESKTVSIDNAPSQYYSDPTQIIGKVLSQPMIEGQVYKKICFPQSGSGLDLASILPTGKRAVNVSLWDYAGLEGLLYPGSIVDVLASFKISSSSSLGRAVSTTLLQSIEVIAVENVTIVSNSEMAEASAQTSSGMSSKLLVTLMVDARQAEALQLAMEHGAIALAMRNPSDTEVYHTDATLLSDGMLAQLAEIMDSSVLADEQLDSADVELAAIEPVTDDRSSSDDILVATAQFRESVSSGLSRRESNAWRVEIIRGLVSSEKIFQVQN